MDALDRLYRRVANALLREPSRMLTVGDLYREVVPYRLIRGELGFAELAEYEHALLRLLAGERDYLELDRTEVQAEFRRELEASNPILGIYRDHADAGVQLNPFAQPPRPEPSAAVVTPPSSVPPRGSAPEATDEALAEAEPLPPLPRPCPGCRAPLPGEREARFCPFCGKCLVAIPCAECSAMLQPDWRFCAGCGWERQSGALSAPRSSEQRLR